MTLHTQKLKVDYLKTIGMTSNNPTGRGFANPVDLAINDENTIIVLNRGAYVFSRITLCDLSENYLGEIGSHGDSDGQFRLPTSIDIDSNQNIYITDEYLNRETVFDKSGSFLSKWGKAGTKPGQISGPSGLAINSDDDLYIVDQGNHRIQKFSKDGVLIKTFGEKGKDNDQLNQPWGISLDKDQNIFVADWRNDRIQKFSPEGNPIMRFGISGHKEGELNRPADVTITKDEYIIVADWGNERVQIFDSKGNFEVLLQGEATVSKWAEDYFAANPDEVTERNKSNLNPNLPDHLKSPYHSASQTEPYFWGPTSVNLDRQGNLYITESARHRFQVYSLKQ